jgi:hypothetical protein
MTCKELENQIPFLINLLVATEAKAGNNKKERDKLPELRKRLEDAKAKFATMNCDVELGNKKVQDIMSLADKFQNVDKTRIQAEQDVLVKKRIFFGVVILLSALVIINSIKN